MKLYHSTATENRGSILKRGLALRIANDDGTEQLSITGGIFFCSKQPEPSEYIDIWEVDTTGLLVIEDDTDVPFDPEDTWWVAYCQPIGPERLTLLEAVSGDISLIG
jgi:hypothetical protein